MTQQPPSFFPTVALVGLSIYLLLPFLLKMHLFCLVRIMQLRASVLA
jgi:hypothetical protein